MGKLGWIIVIVLVLLLFRDRIGEEVNSITRPSGSYGYGGPPPGPNYSSSPPTHQSTSVTDVINNLIGAGVSIYNGVKKSPSSPPGAGPATGTNWDNWSA